MLRREQGLTDKPSDIFRDDSLHGTRPPQLKISTLAPYFTEIERRKKQRSHLHRSKKTIHESSSKSFRIKEKSVTSLQKELFTRGKEFFPKKVPEQTLNRVLDIKRNKQRRTQSVNRTHDIEFSKTIDSSLPKQKPSANNFLSDLEAKVRNTLESKEKEQRKPIRRGRFETMDQRARSQAGQLNMYKISTFASTQGYTNANIKSESPLTKQISEEQKRSDEPRQKKNFRRNKYEAISHEIERKENSNEPNMNLEMDRLAARQNQAFSQVRNRELHGSIEKSTEKYFKYESYRPIRSKNDIEIYLSTVPNPSVHKASSSTNERSDCCNKLQMISSLKPQTKINALLEYDFDFKNEEDTLREREELNQGEEELEESMAAAKEQDSFERQRKKVELQFFHKEHPPLDWSEDECKIDDI